MTYEPKDFSSEAPPPRIIGSEMEYSIQGDVAHLALAQKALKTTGLLPNLHLAKDATPSKLFLLNGGLVYPDVGGTLEYAIPESLGPREAVIADSAGIEIVQRIAKATSDEHDGVYRRVGFMYEKDLRGEENKPLPSNTTTGFHENYLMPSWYAMDVRFHHFISSFLASRSLWSGMGMYKPGVGYSFTQKAMGIGMVAEDGADNRISQGNKPMIRINRDGDTTSDGWARFEVRCMDPNHSKRIRYLGYGATSLMMRLYEHKNTLPNARATIASLTFENPVAVLHGVQHDMEGKNQYKLANGKYITALDHQKMSLEAAHGLAKDIDLQVAAEAAIPDLWESICKDLHRFQTDKCSIVDIKNRFDWAARYVYIGRKFGPDAAKWPRARTMRADIIWDRIDGHSTSTRWWRQQPDEDFIDQAEIDALISTPPKHTRAARRVYYLSNFGLHNGMNWSTVRNEDDKIVHLTHPYRSR